MRYAAIAVSTRWPSCWRRDPTPQGGWATSGALGVDRRSHLLAARWSERSHALSYLLHVEFAVGVLKQAAKVEGTSLVRKRIFNIPALRSQTIERFEH